MGTTSCCYSWLCVLLPSSVGVRPQSHSVLGEFRPLLYLVTFLPSWHVGQVVAVAASSPAVANAQSIEALRGVCVEQINGHDYWLFRVCIGVEVTQYHDQEKYNLGKFVPWVGDPPSEGRQQQFKNGNPCDASPSAGES